MDEHKVKVFCAVAEMKSFVKAARLMRLTQPAISLQIQSLENTLGTKLFDRSGGVIIPTKPGEIFYKYAKEINSLYNSSEKELDKFTAPYKGIVNVGASSTIGNYVLPAVLSEFKKKFPMIKINLFIGNTKSVVDNLYEGNIEMALVESRVKRQRLTAEKFFSDEMVLIFSPLHPWASKSAVSVFDVVKEPFILREEGSATKQLIETFFMKNGIQLQHIKTPFIMGSIESIIGSVEEGLGISIVSEWAARKERIRGRLKTAQFKEDKLTRDFSILYSKSKAFSFVLKMFFEFTKKFPFDKILAY
jgi:DNA-binding transcriptional LysR family regulator